MEHWMSYAQAMNHQFEKIVLYAVALKDKSTPKCISVIIYSAPWRWENLSKFLSLQNFPWPSQQNSQPLSPKQLGSLGTCFKTLKTTCIRTQKWFVQHNQSLSKSEITNRFENIPYKAWIFPVAAKLNLLAYNPLKFGEPAWSILSNVQVNTVFGDQFEPLSLDYGDILCFVLFCFQFFFFYILKVVPIYFNCLAECC